MLNLNRLAASAAVAVLTLGVAIASLYGICLVVLIQVAGWLPLIPSVLAVIGSGGVVAFYRVSLIRNKQ